MPPCVDMHRGFSATWVYFGLPPEIDLRNYLQGDLAHVAADTVCYLLYTKWAVESVQHGRSG
jgi:hypothetical protein